ncbi:MAG TPA: glycosyltransferase [Blastocatellia bacterium]|nr:glycosyltransferase [Blastocatellia bacterium]
MPESRLVTVIIPCYNQGRYLGEAITSALGQGYDDLEVIVVDDGSTDDTAEVAGRYARVSCVRQANRGLAAARNHGLEASRGEYVVFLDADDRLAAGALAVGANALDSHPDCAFVYGHVRLIDSNGSLTLYPPSVKIERDHYLELLRHNDIWSPGAVMYRRSVFDSVGLFDPRVNASADYDLNLRIARRHPIFCHGEVVLEYRKHGSNMTGNFAEMLKTSVAVRRSHRKHVRQNRLQKEALETGIEGVQRDYGEKLIRATRSQVEARQWRQGLTGGVALLKYYPEGLARLIRRKLFRFVSKQSLGSDYQK